MSRKCEQMYERAHEPRRVSGDRRHARINRRGAGGGRRGTVSADRRHIGVGRTNLVSGRRLKRASSLTNPGRRSLMVDDRRAKGPVSRREVYVYGRRESGGLETGVVQFTYADGDDDWPGIFIRGDNAAHFGFIVRQLIESNPEATDPIHMMYLTGLADLLESSDVRKHGAVTMKKDNNT